MAESNNEKTFICVSFYTADEKLRGFNPRKWDSIQKTGTVPAKPGQLEC